MRDIHKSSKIRRQLKVRSRIIGTDDRPRVSVFRSNKHIYVQAINDAKGSTVAAFNSKKTGEAKSNNIEMSKAIGKAFGDILKEKKIQQIVFDRGSYRYHGKVKSLADGIRSAGIKF